MAYVVQRDALSLHVNVRSPIPDVERRVVVGVCLVVEAGVVASKGMPAETRRLARTAAALVLRCSLPWQTKVLLVVDFGLGMFARHGWWVFRPAVVRSYCFCTGLWSVVSRLISVGPSRMAMET